MPFKIVETWEEEEADFRLCVVPSFWEHKNILRWPPKSKRYNLLRLIKNESGKPGPDWDTMSCTVKRRNLPSYAQAEIEVENMGHTSDTDNKEARQQRKEARQHPIETQVTCTTYDFDAYAEALANTDPNPCVSKNTTVDCTDNGSTTTGEVILQVCGNENVLSEKIDTMITMINHLNQVVENVANKICIMSVQLDDVMQQVSSKNDQAVEVTLLKDAKKLTENQSYTFKIIENIQHLNALEVLLSDKTEYKKLKAHLTFLCSPSVGDGKTFSYRLLDAMFTRDFLCLCSWTGGSRGENSKIPLKDYKLFRIFFHQMINSWDSSFTVQSTDDFFKAALKNARKRKAMKDLRASSTKRRINKTELSKKSLQKKDNREQEQNMNENNKEIESAIQEIYVQEEIELPDIL